METLLIYKDVGVQSRQSYRCNHTKPEKWSGLGDRNRYGRAGSEARFSNATLFLNDVSISIYYLKFLSGELKYLQIFEERKNTMNKRDFIVPELLRGWPGFRFCFFFDSTIMLHSLPFQLFSPYCVADTVKHFM